MWSNLWTRAGTGARRAPPNRSLRKRPCRLRLEPLENRCTPAGDVVLHWNELLMGASATPSTPPRVPAFRNMALVSVAVFDAVNSIDRSYTPYAADVHASRGASKEAAAAQAAHDTLVALYPALQAQFDAALADDLAGIPPGLARQGSDVGREVARQILALRSNDHSADVVTYTPAPAPGVWQPTPPDFSPAANTQVPFIPPFALLSTSQFRPPPPPTLTSGAYATDYNYTKLVGARDAETSDRNGDGLPDRTHAQTLQSLDWRLPATNLQTWNTIARQLAVARGTSLAENARLFALLNVGINDGLETSNTSKFFYGLWRPVTAIRHGGNGGAADTAGDPLADGNPATVGDSAWLPLHPTTPPYPTYAGNAATVGATSATVLAAFFGSNDIPFQVHWAVSGETRSYPGFRAAAQEEADSRIFGGIHFLFDSAAGQGIGLGVGNYVVTHILLPRRNASSFQSGGFAAAPHESFLSGQVSAAGLSGSVGFSGSPSPSEGRPQASRSEGFALKFDPMAIADHPPGPAPDALPDVVVHGIRLPPENEPGFGVVGDEWNVAKFV